MTLKSALRWSIMAGLTLALVATGPVNAEPTTSTTDPGSIVSDVSRTSGGRELTNEEALNELREYWTPERMANAIPMDRVEVKGAPAVPQQAPKADGPPITISEPAPPSITRSPNATASVDSVATGKVFFTKSSGGDYVCSASVVNSPSGQLVSTAGHCVHDGGKDSDGWHKNWIFLPAYDDGPDLTTGIWASVAKFTFVGWSQNEKRQYDVGFVVTGTAPGAGAIRDVVGAHGLILDFPYGKVTEISYPVNFHNGERPFFNVDDSAELRDDVFVGIDTPSEGGASGSPFLTDYNGGVGYINSIHTHGYSSIPGKGWGPLFGAHVGDLYDDAEEYAAS
ncbi:serine protease [Salinispora sp. H7-4]|uniref:trypsin-like serine peptidase n=1 Tax=Salinispora sp. H7-4 TaxID=2748321 RepID=UPI001C5516CF|nr:hypothetical protein [Salinispora sp. H7-4]